MRSAALRAVLAAVALFASLSAKADPHACRHADPDAWSPLEQALWQAVRASERFDAARHSADPKGRVLEPAFLRTLLTCDSLIEDVPDRGIELQGVLVPRPLDLRFAHVPVRFVCARCVLEGLDASASRWDRALHLVDGAVRDAVRFEGAVFAETVSFRGTRIPGGLDLSGVEAARQVDLQGLRGSPVVALDAAEVGRTLDLRFLEDVGTVGLRDARIGGKLRLDGARIEALDLTGGQVGDQAILSGIRVAERVVLDKAELASDLLVRRWPDGPAPVLGTARPVGPELHDTFEAPVLDLDNADIGGRIEIAWAELRGAVSLDAVRVGEDIWMRDCTVVHGAVRLPFARVGQNIDLSTAALRDVNATGALIGGELRLGIPELERFTAPVWAPGATLRLRNASAASWVDRADVETRAPDCPAVEGVAGWPERIDVIGFAYRGLGGLGGGAIEARDTRWFAAWLERQEPVSFEPYQRLAGALDATGRERKARAVLYAGKERLRRDAEGGHRPLLLWLQKVFVGYGVYKEVVLIWIGALTVLGWLVVRSTPQAQGAHPPLDLVYSFDQLIQLVQLRPETKTIQFEGFARWYMYGHRFMGWVLGGFLLAAFAGLFGT